jgi:hypothetical protein
MSPEIHGLGLSADDGEPTGIVASESSVALSDPNDPVNALTAMGIPEWEAAGMIARASGAEAVLCRWRERMGASADGRDISNALDAIAITAPDVAQALLWDRLAAVPVMGGLDLSGAKWLLALPPGTTINGSLVLDGCSALAALPDDLVVSGRLSILECPNLTLLPEGIRIGERVAVDQAVRIDRVLNIDEALDRGLTLDEAIALCVASSTVLKADRERWEGLIGETSDAFLKAPEAAVNPDLNAARLWEHRILELRERGRDLAEAIGIPKDRTDRILGLALRPALTAVIATGAVTHGTKHGCPADIIVDGLNRLLDLDTAGDPLGRKDGMVNADLLSRIIGILDAGGHMQVVPEGLRLGWWDQVRPGWHPPARPSLTRMLAAIETELDTAVRKGELKLYGGEVQELGEPVKEWLQRSERGVGEWIPAFHATDLMWRQADEVMLEGWALSRDINALDIGIHGTPTDPERFREWLPKRQPWVNIPASERPDWMVVPDVAAPRPGPVTEPLKPAALHGPAGEWLAAVVELGMAPIIAFHQGTDPVTDGMMGADLSELVAHVGRIRAAEALRKPSI